MFEARRFQLREVVLLDGWTLHHVEPLSLYGVVAGIHAGGEGTLERVEPFRMR